MSKRQKRFTPGSDYWTYGLKGGHYRIIHGTILMKEPPDWRDHTGYGASYVCQPDGDDPTSQYVAFLFHTEREAKRALELRLKDWIGTLTHHVNAHLREAFRQQKEVETLQSDLDDLIDAKEY